MKNIYLFLIVSLILLACGPTPSEQFEATEQIRTTSTFVTSPAPNNAPPLPTQSPTAVVQIWDEFPIIDSSSQIVISNETKNCQLKEVFGSGLILDADTRWTFDVQVENLIDDVGESSTAMLLVGYTKSGIKQKIVIGYQFGNWGIGYMPDEADPGSATWHTLENLTNPTQHFEIFISSDGQTISITNNAGFELQPIFKEKVFDGAEVIMVNAQIGLGTRITISKLIVSQSQDSENSQVQSAINQIPESQEIADAGDMPSWIDEYVHAYDGLVMVNGIEMNSGQLTDEIRLNGNEFIVTKIFNEIEYQFFILNGVPLAIREGNGQWQEATLKILGTMLDLKIGSLISEDKKLNRWWGSEYHIGFITIGLSADMPSRDYIDFGWPNYQTEIAHGNGMETMFEAVFYPADVPLWTHHGFTQYDLDNMTRMIVGNAKEHHIDYIAVANEVRIPADWETPDIYWEKFGIDYIIRAYQIARDMYPESFLIYDDTGNHLPGTFGTETTLLVSQALYEEGLIDYVGIQMHVEPHEIPTKDGLIEIFRNYPVPVVITSFDALLTNLPSNEHNEKLNEITRVVFDGCLESGVCHSITTWGENDSVGWEGRSLLRDVNNKRKQAYYVAMQSMYEHLPWLLSSVFHDLPNIGMDGAGSAPDFEMLVVFSGPSARAARSGSDQ